MPVYTDEAYEQLAAGQFTTGGGVLYTLPTGVRSAIIKHIRVVNIDSSDRTFSIRQTTGGVGATSDIILPTATVLAGGWAEFDGAIILDTGSGNDALYGFASTALVVNYFIYGLELI